MSKSIYCLISFLMLFVSSALADVVVLDISSGCNYDGYISDAESEHAELYDPPADWNLSGRMVHHVFGDHSASVSGRNYAWQAQVPAGGTGLPDNGEITTSYGTFELSTALDAEPVGGFVQTTKPTSPTGVLAISDNVVRAYRPHTGSTGTAEVSASVTLPAAQQDYYDSINFLVSGSNGKCMIYADYDDGSGGTDQELIYTSPGTPRTVDETGFPDLLASSSANSDIIEVASYQMDYSWGQTGVLSDVRNTTARIWTFNDPLTLDSSKKLVGFTVAIYDEDTWKTRTAIIYAACANTSARTIHVDGVAGDDTTGDGSASNPYETLTKARSEVESGDTIVLYDGNYGSVEEVQSLPLVEPFTDWVTIKAADGCSPELEHIYFGANGSGYTGSDGLRGAYNVYMKFEGLTINDGVASYGAKHWELNDCLIERYGPWTGSVDNIEKTAVFFRCGTDIVIDGCEITNTGTAISGQGHEVQVLNSDIHGGKHDGIRVSGWWDSLVEGNKIYDFDDGVTDAQATWSRHCDLIHIFIAGPGPEGWQNHNVTFRNNVLYDTEAQCVQFNNYYASSIRNEQILFENNIFGPAHANMFNNADPCDGLIFRNNTVCVLDSPRTFGNWTLDNYNLRISYLSTDVEVYNNILGVASIEAGCDVDMFDYNLILSPSTVKGVDGSRAYGRFTIIGGDADFVDADAFDGELASTSDAIDVGTALFAPDTVYATDIVGTDRDNRPDMGAWELPGQSPTAESSPPVYNDTKTIFVDDFEDGHYNDVDPWLQDVATQGLSWSQDSAATYKYYVTHSDTVLTRNALYAPIGVSGQQREAWLFSDQGSDWADYEFTFTAYNSYLTIGSGVLILAQDEGNCYWLDISRDNGRLIRIMNGTATTLALDSDIEMPHLGEQSYAVTVEHVTGGIIIEVDVDDDGTVDMSYTDTDSTALTTFTAGGVGFHDDTDAVHLTLKFDDISVEVFEFE